MLASTIDIGFPPAWHSAVMQTQEHAKAPINSPSEIVVFSAYLIGNAVTMERFGRAIEAAPVTDSVSREYLPRTPLGITLLALRRAYIANGGRLIDSDQLDIEMDTRRGGTMND